MTEKKHPLAGIENMYKVFADQRDEGFEEECVKQLLAAFEIPKYKFVLLQKNYEEIGRRILTLVGLCRHLDGFPVVLQSLTGSFTMSDKLHFLLQDFEKRAPVQKFLEMRRELPTDLQDRPFGLVLKWPYMPKGLIVHTIGDTDLPGSRLTFRRKGLTVVAEPFPQFIHWLRKVWSPAH